ncbi:hypothetical protein DENSPDRAFT_132763 [Dentipellis sp. KUC8613]|nr:hypothetical protein DENSPDRAFT_132763 [Dentipellis sp. KUC8613]
MFAVCKRVGRTVSKDIDVENNGRAPSDPHYEKCVLTAQGLLIWAYRVNHMRRGRLRRTAGPDWTCGYLYRRKMHRDGELSRGAAPCAVVRTSRRAELRAKRVMSGQCAACEGSQRGPGARRRVGGVVTKYDTLCVQRTEQGATICRAARAGCSGVVLEETRGVSWRGRRAGDDKEMTR